MNNTFVTIIIVNYNVRELLLKCLESIVRFTANNISLEIIVVDNNSSDGSVQSVKEKYPDVLLIENKINAGFPFANNQGIRIAKGEFVLLLNPDTEFIEDSISVLKNYLENNTEVSLLAPQLLNSDRSIQKSIFRFPKIKYLIAEMIYLEYFTSRKYYSERNHDEIFEIDSASGAALFFRKKLSDEIGMLNEKLFWIEDIDFCYRIHQNGGKVLYFPKTKIIHHSGRSAIKNYNISISNQVVNKIKYYKLNGNPFSLFIVYLISTINVIVRMLVFAMLSPFHEKYYLKMKAYWFTLSEIFSATNDL